MFVCHFWFHGRSSSFGVKGFDPTMKAFVKMHVVYIMILAFCGLRIRKHYFE